LPNEKWHQTHGKQSKTVTTPPRRCLFLIGFTPIRKKQKTPSRLPCRAPLNSALRTSKGGFTWGSSGRWYWGPWCLAVQNKKVSCKIPLILPAPLNAELIYLGSQKKLWNCETTLFIKRLNPIP